MFGSIFFLAAPEGGWFMYPPLTSHRFQPGIGADIWLLGLSFVEVASIAAAVELIIGVLKTRPPGMSINLIPLYAWYILATGAMILFAFPPLIAGDILLELERAFDWPFFDPDRGGDPILWQHLFWIFGHPEVYIIFLPAVGVVAMIVPTFAQRPIVGYTWIVLAAVGTGFISFGLWVHHMYATGLPKISLGYFSAASEAVVIPTGVQIFAFIATLFAGKVRVEPPMLFVFGFLFTFVIGGLSGVMVALVPFDLQVHDTYFVVAHLHYVLIGGMLFPMFAAAYYWGPVISGRKLLLGRPTFWLMFLGFHIAFFPMHFTGLLGMPRRVYTYPEGLGWDWLNLTSTIGAFMFASGVLVFLVDVVLHFWRGEKVGRNPWNAGTLDWMMEIPPKDWGARSVPIVATRYPLWQQDNFLDDVDNGRFLIPDAPGHAARDDHHERGRRPAGAGVARPGNSWWPLLAAIATGGFFIFATFHLWTPTLLSAALAFALILCWLWTTAEIPERNERDAGCGYVLPLYVSGPQSVGWWAMFITVLADGTAYVSLIFAYFYFWTVAPDWPRDGRRGGPAGPGARPAVPGVGRRPDPVGRGGAARRRNPALQARGMARLRVPPRLRRPRAAVAVRVRPRPHRPQLSGDRLGHLPLSSVARRARRRHGPLRARPLLGRAPRAGLRPRPAQRRPVLVLHRVHGDPGHGHGAPFPAGELSHGGAGIRARQPVQPDRRAAGLDRAFPDALHPDRNRLRPWLFPPRVPGRARGAAVRRRGDPGRGGADPGCRGAGVSALARHARPTASPLRCRRTTPTTSPAGAASWPMPVFSSPDSR